jgi:alpha-N-arabinofuranosidase
VLRTEVRSPRHETARYGYVPIVDAVATRDAEAGAITVLAVNRSATDPVSLEVDLRAFGAVRLVEAVTLTHADPYAKATADDAEDFAPSSNATATVDAGRARVELPPVSWSMLRLAT